MDTETEEIIKEQFKQLPEEIVALFSNAKLNEQIEKVGTINELTETQLSSLLTETSLLILGLINPDDYKNELKNELNITETPLNRIVENIFSILTKENVEKLKFIYKKNNDSTNKPIILDPRFIGMPKEIQEAVAKSDWKEKLYKISKDYNLNIEQMGILEDTTVKVMKNETPPNKYESEVTSKITIPREDVSSLVKDVNDTILLKIRELMRVNEGQEDVPIPPYAQNNLIKEEVPTPPYKETIKKEESISTAVKSEINNEKTAPKQEDSKKINDATEKDELKDAWEAKPSVISPEIKSAPLNIMDEKLKSVTMSDHVVTDYSIPKISDLSKEAHEAPAKSNDPYREAF